MGIKINNFVYAVLLALLPTKHLFILNACFFAKFFAKFCINFELLSIVGLQVQMITF